jgi:hypothetical protein
MPTDGDKIAAATLAAAMLRPIEPTGSFQEDIKVRDRAIEFADRLYKDLLATILPAAAQDPAAVPPPIEADPA